jgi:hypothetical protein
MVALPPSLGALIALRSLELSSRSRVTHEPEQPYRVELGRPECAHPLELLMPRHGACILAGPACCSGRKVPDEEEGEAGKPEAR